MKLKQVGSNQTELELNDGTLVFFSYETPVAARLSRGYAPAFGGESVKTSKKWSRTTSKHINQWLNRLDSRGIGDGSALPCDQSLLDELIK